MMTKAQNAKRIANLRATLAAKKSQRLQAQPVLNVQLAFALELRKVLNRTFYDHDAPVAK